MFRLELSNPLDSRWAVLDPLQSTLVWEDTGQDVLPAAVALSFAAEEFKAVHPTAPHHPAPKQRNPERIKIQLGFACNYSCAYCSQSSIRSQEGVRRLSPELVQEFIAGLSSWYFGGHNGKGQGTQFEFWGGETLLYWSSVVQLARHLRENYPQAELVLFTNGSLIREEMIPIAEEFRIKFSISHDGRASTKARHRKDPLSDEGNGRNIRALFHRLNPKGLVSFNAALTLDNYSLLDVRLFIARQLVVPEREVILSFDIVTPYDEKGLTHVVSPERFAQFVRDFFEELKSIPLTEIHLGSLDRLLTSFYKLFRQKRPVLSLPQRCQMDSPEFLAVDLKGNALTCQNVSQQSGHGIGHVRDYENIRLSTAFHWSQRKECTRCPVVMLCRGSCMFLQDRLWQSACDQFFAFHIPILAYALYLATDRYLTKIEGQNIRGEMGLDSISVLNLERPRQSQAVPSQLSIY